MGIDFGERRTGVALSDPTGTLATPLQTIERRPGKRPPLKALEAIAREHEVLITVEEGSIGGFASHVLDFLARDGALDAGLRIRPMALPATFIDQGKPHDMYDEAHLNAADIVRTALSALGQDLAGASVLA